MHGRESSPLLTKPLLTIQTSQLHHASNPSAVNVFENEIVLFNDVIKHKCRTVTLNRIEVSNLKVQEMSVNVIAPLPVTPYTHE